MGAEITELAELVKTLETAAKSPDSVSIGDFANAVQSLQAELKMLEAGVDRLGGTVATAFGEQGNGMPAETQLPAADETDQAAASKP